MKKFLKTLILPVVIVCCAFLFVGCGNLKDYDMSKITFESRTVVYNGSQQSLAIDGTLPNGVTVSYEYYKGTTKLNGAPTDAGEYKVVAKFTGDSKNFNTIPNKEATLIIEQAELPVVFGAKQKVGENNKKEDLDEPKTFTNNNGIFSCEFDGNVYYVTLLNEDADNYEVSYYNELNEDGTPKEESISDGKIEDAEKPLYALVTALEENANYKDSTVATIKLTKRNINLTSADDLKKLKTNIFEESYKLRLNTVYNLLNDIDLTVEEEKGLWNIPASWYPNNSGKSFNSEFNGNGHTIKNFKITNESIETNVPNGCGDGRYGDTMVGFFGFVTDAYIHDVNFTDFEITIDRNTPLFVGVLAARVEDTTSDGIEWTKYSKFENINVENCTMDINTKKGYCGIFIGADNTSGDRKNLNASNVTINLNNTYSQETTKVAGIVGEIGTRGKNVKYEDCHLENIVLTNGDEQHTTSAYEAFVAAFVADNRSNSTFINCTIKDFKMSCYSNGTLHINGYYGWQRDNTIITMEGCSYSEPKECTTGILKYTYAGNDWTETNVDWVEPQGPVAE